MTIKRYSRVPRPAPRGGRRADLGGMFFRSSWEANIARYLDWAKRLGAVTEWSYESETFWFEKIRRGSRSYTPDFRIMFAGDSKPVYWEVKGWMDQKSRTKLKRMAKYYPEVTVVVIGEREYGAIQQQAKGVIDQWE